MVTEVRTPKVKRGAERKANENITAVAGPSGMHQTLNSPAANVCEANEAVPGLYSIELSSIFTHK